MPLCQWTPWLSDFGELVANVSGIQGKLVVHNMAYVLCRVSRTGLKKSILDAAKDLRFFLKEAGYHDFEAQLRGEAYKKILPIKLITRAGALTDSSMTLYRSRTRGDCRFWIRGLSDSVLPDDDLIITQRTDGLLAFNSSMPEELVDKIILPLSGVSPSSASIFEKLLNDLRALGREGYILAPEAGSSSVGRLLEQRLGIAMNSSKNPDYQGIEIKSGRNPRSRSTLFSQVPAWDRSRLKSSSEVLREFGYPTPEGRKLSCTLSVPTANSQDLYLHVDRDERMLHARHNELDPRDVVVWPLDILEHRFAHKHAETIWVDAVSRSSEGKEYIRFVSAEHTTSPKVDQLASLLRQGRITVDFLIREGGDKGYLFKVAPDSRTHLFNKSRSFSLTG